MLLFYFYFSFFHFPVSDDFYVQIYFLFLISGIWGSYVIYYLRVSVAKIF